MKEQKTHPVPGNRQAEKPETLDRPVEALGDTDERAVAKAVIDLESSDRDLERAQQQ